MTKPFTTFIFWGAIWGAAEATLGWVLHAMHVHGVGFWMYPIALACMMAAYRASGKASSICYVALVAGLVKLTDLMLPMSGPAFYTINPAIHIMLEGVGVAMFVKLASMRRLPLAVSYLAAESCLLLSGFAWRLWQSGASALWMDNPGARLFWTAERMLPWLGQTLVLSALVVGAYAIVLRIGRKPVPEVCSMKRAVGTLMLAIAVTFVSGL